MVESRYDSWVTQTNRAAANTKPSRVFAVAVAERTRFLSMGDAGCSGLSVALCRAMRAEGVGKAALAKRLGVALPQVDRRPDPRPASRRDAIKPALAALGREVAVVVRAAA